MRLALCGWIIASFLRARWWHGIFCRCHCLRWRCFCYSQIISRMSLDTAKWIRFGLSRLFFFVDVVRVCACAFFSYLLLFSGFVYARMKSVSTIGITSSELSAQFKMKKCALNKLFRPYQNVEGSLDMKHLSNIRIQINAIQNDRLRSNANIGNLNLKFQLIRKLFIRRTIRIAVNGSHLFTGSPANMQIVRLHFNFVPYKQFTRINQIDCSRPLPNALKQTKRKLFSTFTLICWLSGRYKHYLRSSVRVAVFFTFKQ